jgi:Zn-dependent protease
MMNIDRELLFRILIQAPALILAVAFHEAAHGWAANRLGDPTAKLMGRVSLNPIRHIDLVGSIIVPVFLSLAGNFMFGWAKPVPVIRENLNNPRRDNALVAVAGPTSNLLLALAAAILTRALLLLPAAVEFFVAPLVSLCLGLILINTILAVFNMIPIPPLDGSHVLAAFLPVEAAEKYESVGQWGMFLIIILVSWNPLGLWTKIMNPAIMKFVMLFQTVAGIS